MKTQNVNSWSFSKSRLFNKCPKAFFFSNQDVKGAANCYPLGSLIGISVHLGIKNIINSWINNEKVDIKTIISVSNNFLKHKFENSENIIEFKNGIKIENEIVDKFNFLATKHIKWFYKMIWPNIRRHEYILHEKLDSFYLEGIQIWVKLDLLVKLGDHYFIFDWKTDKADRFTQYIDQMHVYSIWTSEKYQIPLNIINSQIVNLTTCTYHKLNHNITNVENIKKQIINEVERWNIVLKENFQAFPSYINCSGCRFYFLCEESKSVINQK